MSYFLTKEKELSIYQIDNYSVERATYRVTQKQKTLYKNLKGTDILLLADYRKQMAAKLPDTLWGEHTEAPFQYSEQ